MDVSLSLSRWQEGRGLVKECSLKGVRGIVDRRHLQWDYKNWIPTRREGEEGDFELDKFSVSDLLLSVRQPGGFRPFSVSVFAAELPILRRQWVLYDVLSAETCVGLFENCLFSIHKPQMTSDFPRWDGNENKEWSKMV
jgi:distribution and morphology protein 31